MTELCPEPSKELLDFFCRIYPKSSRGDLAACYRNAAPVLMESAGYPPGFADHPCLPFVRKHYVHAMHGPLRERCRALQACWDLLSPQYESIFK